MNNVSYLCLNSTQDRLSATSIFSIRPFLSYPHLFPNNFYRRLLLPTPFLISLYSYLTYLPHYVFITSLNVSKTSRSIVSHFTLYVHCYWWTTTYIFISNSIQSNHIFTNYLSIPIYATCILIPFFKLLIARHIHKSLMISCFYKTFLFTFNRFITQHSYRFLSFHFATTNPTSYILYNSLSSVLLHNLF